MSKLSEAADEATRDKEALARELASCKTQLKVTLPLLCKTPL